MTDDVRSRVLAAFPDMCARLAAGELIKPMLAEYGISRSNLSIHALQTPALRIQWDAAREASADALFEQALHEAWREDVDKESAQHVRTRIDTLKWAARIRNPRMYSDKSTVDVNVRTVDLTQIIRDANARLAAQQAGRIIDATHSNGGIERDTTHAQSVLPAPTIADLM